MTKKFITTAIVATAFIPFLASAQGTATETPVAIKAVLTTTTPNHIFTACTQVAIEKRDTAIATSKATYNTAMESALTARKEAEKTAVALPDGDAKRAALASALDAYKASARSAQDALTKARKDIWTAFETDQKSCREAMKAANESALVERKKEQALKKASTTEMRVEKKAILDARKASTTLLKAERKSELDARKASTTELRAEIKKTEQEIKLIREESKSRIQILRDKIRAFWSR